MKIIKVNSCKECPFVDTFDGCFRDRVRRALCKKTRFDVSLKDCWLPHWCPLEDYKEAQDE